MARLYTYLPKDNTALTEGLLSTVLTDRGFEKYRGRTGKYKKEDVLKVLDSWEPEWTRSKAISALTEPIPPDAAEDFLQFAKDRRLYSFDTKDLIRARILAHIRRTRKGGGTDPVDDVRNERPNWHRKKKHLLFQGVPHYMVETTGGKIPPEFVREEKQAGAKIDIPSVYDEVRKAYAGMGYPVSGDRLVLSEQPTYVDGRPVPKDVIKPNSSGGNTQDDGMVRINPRYRAVMRHWGLKGSGRDFLRTIIGHELGHHVDRTVLSGRSAERRRLLREISRTGFHTVYTDSYGPDTDPRKLDKELLAEYLARQVSDRLGKQAAASDIEAKARLHYPAEGSHGWNHIQDVLANARRMRRRELRRNELAAIMYHDSSLMTGGRETHADDSAAIARKELAGLFRKRQLADIANAIAHHRASYEGARGSRLEDLVAAADRPVPDLAKQVARSWKYHEELGEPEGLRAENVASHLREKYGHGGYAYGNAPRLYLKTYGRELRDIMSKFDGLTPESVAAIMSGAEKKAAMAGAGNRRVILR